MARDFSRAFYKTEAWQRARELCLRAHHGLCAHCAAKGDYVRADVVHHKVKLTPENVNDPWVTLSQDNLVPLCHDCHSKQHPEIFGRKPVELSVRFDADGNVVDEEEAE